MFLSSCVLAQQDDSQSVPVEKSDVVDLKKQVKSRSGYEADDIVYGGRASVGKQLYLDDILAWQLTTLNRSMRG